MDLSSCGSSIAVENASMMAEPTVHPNPCQMTFLSSQNICSLRHSLICSLNHLPLHQPPIHFLASSAADSYCSLPPRHLDLFLAWPRDPHSSCLPFMAELYLLNASMPPKRLQLPRVPEAQCGRICTFPEPSSEDHWLAKSGKRRVWDTSAWSIIWSIYLSAIFCWLMNASLDPVMNFPCDVISPFPTLSLTFILVLYLFYATLTYFLNKVTFWSIIVCNVWVYILMKWNSFDCQTNACFMIVHVSSNG